MHLLNAQELFPGFIKTPDTWDTSESRKFWGLEFILKGRVPCLAVSQSARVFFVCDFAVLR